jgi:hypothetical protein
MVGARLRPQRRDLPHHKPVQNRQPVDTHHTAPKVSPAQLHPRQGSSMIANADSLYDDELDDIASALDALDDLPTNPT